MSQQKLLIFKLIIETQTPLHCGGGMDDILDQPVARDAFGLWRIPGSSLAGILRSVAQNLDEKLAATMFGCQEGDQSHASLVWCEDALLLDYDGQPAIDKFLCGKQPAIKCESFVRDHVKIHLDKGSACEGGKFDCEFVPAGARFLLEFRCDGWDRALTPAEEAFFEQLVAEIQAGKLMLGGKTGLGYGQYKTLQSEYSSLDLGDRQGMEQWLNQKARSLPQGGCQPSPTQSAAKAAPGLSGWLHIPLLCKHPILIGGGKSERPGNVFAEADMLFALTPRLVYEDEKKNGHMAYQPVLPSSSLKGVLRHAIYNILQDLSAGEASQTILTEIFGDASGENGQCGKLVVSDCPLAKNYKPEDFVFEPHVAIDRFAGAPVDGALFSEEPFWQPGCQVNLSLAVNALSAHEAALFIHALLDLFDGALAFGSGVNRGNGRLELPGWKTHAANALKAVQGDLAWNGVKVFADDNALENLASLAKEWDEALTRRLANG